MNKIILATGTVIAALIMGTTLAGSPPLTSPQTQSFNVKLTITKECDVGTISDIDFTPGAGVGFLSSALTATTTISVGCTKGTVATIALSNGGNFASGTRHMKLGSDLIAYDLYTDAAHTTVWNATNTQNATGTGAVSGGAPTHDQSLTVFGLVPSQNTGAPGLYTDAVTASVTF